MKTRATLPALLLGLALAACTSLPGFAPGPDVSDPATLPDIKQSTAHKGEALDLTGFRPTFTDDFNTLSITNESGAGPWYAPVHGSFGAAKFLPPEAPEKPFVIRDGHLLIRLQRNDAGKWVGGLAQTANKQGEGFLQKYGYFEMRAKLDGGLGAWSAFWLHAHPAHTPPGMPSTEIDVIEAYGGDMKGHHAAIHLWPVKKPLQSSLAKQWGTGTYSKIPELFQGFHTYGVLVTPQTTIFYFDRKELSRMPTLTEFKVPLYMLINQTMFPGNGKKAQGLREMDIDYVRVWQNDAYRD